MGSLTCVPNIRELIAKYKLEVFVETGCDKGVGLTLAKELGLSPRYSCDIHQPFVDHCAHLGMVVCAKSTDFLKELLPAISGRRCLFWLDAHFIDIDTPGSDTWWPLPQELRILVFKEGIERDVVMCDDIRVVNSSDNPCWYAGQDSNCVANGTSIAYLSAILPLKPTIHNIDTGILVLEPL